ncbi:hypothetical protein GYMLUDRAFT_249828 [Collybiopsis luxurians FD-317 M1]|uniref:T6SS Phospholipase effector Tle1-like catalytic domain-containing protein n=1 Tax=Collybiopsis luxurians FD-317 M1 TaxID=944289 RepID=A0A0D0C824_9AGAR|nr:hypothetical protein GYMLUDRAFT_249828 [Collybiopsis luxurians FD-317 M1]
MKRIIVACDGTGQSSSRGKYSVSTNVNRLCHALSNSPDIVQQVVFYQSGIGTEDLGWGGVGAVYSQALGEGIEENIDDAYTFIMNNYQPGDKIFIFGFSRGAFTARVLANFIARVGVYRKPEYTWAFKRAMKAYKDGTLDKDIKTHKYYTPKFGEPVLKVHEAEIEVVGCWDTVASLGVPEWKNPGGVSGDYKHFSGGLVKGIKHAFHALALDECRRPFSPTLWYLPKDAEVAKLIDLQQCWFPGVHTNVGGGYQDQAIADLTLAWMIDRCRPFLDFDSKYINLVVDLDHQPWKIYSNDRPSRLKDPVNGYDREYQGWGRGRWYDSYSQGQTWTWKYRTPGAYTDDGETKKTNETIHPSVLARWQSSRKEGGELRDGPGVWDPKALKGFEPRKGADGSWEWVKKKNGKDVLIIREAPFPARDTLPENLTSVETEVSFEGLLRYAPAEPESPSHKKGFLKNIH